MYKIYNRNTETNISFKNLKEVERFLIHDFVNTGNIILKTYWDVNDHIYFEQAGAGEKYYFGHIHAVSYNYARDSFGNPLYMILVFINNRCVGVEKSKQSYNIDATVQQTIKKYL